MDDDGLEELLATIFVPHTVQNLAFAETPEPQLEQLVMVLDYRTAPSRISDLLMDWSEKLTQKQ